MGISLFVLGLCGILLFFYMAYLLFTNFPVLGTIRGTDTAQITMDFYVYLTQLIVPILILLIVGGVSILVAQYGIATYSRTSEKSS